MHMGWTCSWRRPRAPQDSLYSLSQCLLLQHVEQAEASVLFVKISELEAELRLSGIGVSTLQFAINSFLKFQVSKWNNQVTKWKLRVHHSQSSSQSIYCFILSALSLQRFNFFIFSEITSSDVVQRKIKAKEIKNHSRVEREWIKFYISECAFAVSLFFLPDVLWIQNEEKFVSSFIIKRAHTSNSALCNLMLQFGVLFRGENLHTSKWDSSRVSRPAGAFNDRANFLEPEMKLITSPYQVRSYYPRVSSKSVSSSTSSSAYGKWEEKPWIVDDHAKINKRKTLTDCRQHGQRVEKSPSKVPVVIVHNSRR